jgi:hypothetical protein
LNFLLSLKRTNCNPRGVEKTPDAEGTLVIHQAGNRGD